ncbi:MAG: choice-of-anchor D domain-containing protein [Verrucomicrobiae bacterium]|nr:choice-of-anchor D domain-containing protein [Verrucomicrobiae bacterium]MCP5532500.1 choice-of-anchor D domain-containing protein [Akkermansiaceae bacterium]MCP5545528.1 choice-of-anchor D domain-containing protein [Akkermansiaceae bacterium]MCP5545765.1 choice-of-anchor D domain-containing protein [Akkermansiaceae bacterium]
MKHSLIASAALALVSIGSADAKIVGQTFTGATTSQPSELTAEFPTGTKWTLRVEWDDSAAPLFTSDTQSQWRVTKLTLTLQGKSGAWTCSSVSGQPSFTLNEYGGSDEIQFTSGWGPAAHTNQTIGSLQPYSINLVIADPTGTAFNGVTPVPSMIDLSKFDMSQSHLKFYLDNNATKTLFGSIDFASDPDISVSQGKNLKDGKSTVGYGKVKTGRKKSRTFTIRNTGEAPLVVKAAKVSGKAKKDFKVGPMTKNILAPGQKKTVKVTFKPKKKGNRKALLKILSNDPDEGSFDIKLEGKGK